MTIRLLLACCLLAVPVQAQVAGCPNPSAQPKDPAVAPLVTAVQRLLATDEVDKALALVQQDIAAHPNDSRLEDARGRVLYRDAKLQEAIEAFNLAMKIDPCDGRVHYDAWRVYAMAGVWERAQHQLQLAKDLWPTQPLMKRLWANTQAPLPEGVVADTPPHFDFYARHYDCDGIAVRGEDIVNPLALAAACAHMRTMLAHLPNVRVNMATRGAELHIMGEDQRVSDLPEFRNERGERIFVRKGDAPNSAEKIDIDALAGATGGLYANCPEINLMHMPGDGYGLHDEVCIHEFAHDIMGAGFDNAMRSQIDKAYQSSMKKGLWKGAYAATNRNEWWAEISVWYFGGQGGIGKMTRPIPAPGPEALKAYDPEAFAVADRLYSGGKQPKVVHEHILSPIREIAIRTGPNPDDARIVFVNNGPVRRYIYWLDGGGMSHSYGVLEPYSRKIGDDYIGRCWMIVDPRTRAQLLFAVTDGESEIVVE